MINFGNLKPGTHLFEFEIGDKFFEQFEYSLVKHGRLEVSLEVEKQNESFLVFTFKMHGNIQLQCDRCLDEYQYPLSSDEKLVLKLVEEPAESEDDDIVFLSADSYQIDVSPYIYEYINIALPLKSECSLGGKECNADMLSALKNVNSQLKDEDTTDPRWEGLKGLN